MLFVHYGTSHSISHCIKHLINIISDHEDLSGLNIVYINGTIEDRLQYLVSKTKLSSNDELLKNFNYEKVDNIASLHKLLQTSPLIHANEKNKTVIVIEGVQEILKSGIINYSEKNLYLTEVLMFLKKLEAESNEEKKFEAIILDEFNYFVSLYSNRIIKV